MKACTCIVKLWDNITIIYDLRPNVDTVTYYINENLFAGGPMFKNVTNKNKRQINLLISTSYDAS